jgi:NTE family protein
VPIDHYSYEGVELIRDTAARWKLHREVRLSGSFAGADNTALAEVLEVPEVDVHVIDVSFAALGDPAERDYLNRLPTSFALPPEAVDRLRAAAGAIVLESPDFRQYLRAAGDRIVKVPAPAGKPAPGPR